MANKMPVLFVGHGSPMNAIEENEYSRIWQKMGQSLPRPKAILSISAHWETPTPQVTGMAQPKTIHDFYGFPRELNEMIYPALGSPELAQRVQQLFGEDKLALDERWGLDHGTWSVLARMFPEANIPVVQFSLMRSRTGQVHYDLGKALAPLREEGVLIIGSGNIVHNLAMIQWDGGVYPWAERFDAAVKKAINQDQPEALVEFQKLPDAQLAINSGEHYLPLLYILALRDKGERVTYFNEEVSMGSLSMRCVQFG